MRRDNRSHMDVCLGLYLPFNFCLSPKQTKNNCQFQVNCLFTLVMANREIAGAIIRGELWDKCQGIHLHRTNNWGNGEIFVIGPQLAITFTLQTEKARLNLLTVAFRGGNSIYLFKFRIFLAEHRKWVEQVDARPETATDTETASEIGGVGYDLCDIVPSQCMPDF